MGCELAHLSLKLAHLTLLLAHLSINSVHLSINSVYLGLKLTHMSLKIAHLSFFYPYSYERSIWPSSDLWLEWADLRHKQVNFKQTPTLKWPSLRLKWVNINLKWTGLRLKWISRLTFEAKWRIWRISNIFMNQIPLFVYQLVCQLTYLSVSWAICKQMFSRPTISHLCYMFIWEMCMFLSLCFLISRWESHWENFFSHFSPWEKNFLIFAPLISTLNQ